MDCQIADATQSCLSNMFCVSAASTGDMAACQLLNSSTNLLQTVVESNAPSSQTATWDNLQKRELRLMKNRYGGALTVLCPMYLHKMELVVEVWWCSDSQDVHFKSWFERDTRKICST